MPAGEFHIKACKRHLEDRAREDTDDFPYVFVWEAWRLVDGTPRLRQCARRFFEFAVRVRHYKGEWAGKRFRPSACQVFHLGSIFGWRHRETGFRRFTSAYNEIPRKNGKSFEAAIVSLYCTFYEGEPGAEGYCIATKRQQAKVVFNDAKKLVTSSGLRARISVQANNLHRLETDSKLEPLGADADSTDGLNPYFICTDEFHAHKNRDLIDVMESATGARRNPMHFQITTAGNDPVSPCGDQHDYATKVLNGVLDDLSARSFFAFIAHADDKDDPFSELTWRKANPHYGLSVKPDDLRKLAEKAQQMPSAAAELKQKRLNLWVNADQPWLSMDGWRRGQTTTWTAKDLHGRMCWGGVDLSSKIDLAAFSLVFPMGGDRWRVLAWAFTPADTLLERQRRDRAPYQTWVDQKYLTTCPGSRINYKQILEVIGEQKKVYAIQGVGFDPWNAENLQTDLVDELEFSDAQVVEIPQTYAGMSAACKDAEADVLGGVIDAGDNPLMRWCASNVVVQRDGKDNLFPVKKRSKGRIDPMVAMLVARALHKRVGEVKKKRSVYASRPAVIVTSEGVRPIE